MGLAISVPYANANVWTVDCSILTTQRMDPIIFPDQSPAGHVHAIVGSSKFNPSQTYEELQQSQCNSCNAGEDMSNYWVPQLYIYKQSDGKYHHVPMEFHVYYKLINDNGQTSPPGQNNPIVPGEFSDFAEGFRILVGSPYQTGPDPNIQHQCLGPGLFTSGFPTNPEQCYNGVRVEAPFPSCWDGVTLEAD